MEFMKQLKKIVFKILDFSQLPRIGRYLSRKKVIILTYHSFTDQTSFEDIEDYQDMRLNVENFKKHLRLLSSHYNVIPIDQVVAHYSEGTEIPDNSVVITIDDGYQGVYDFAFPVLRDFRMPATFFLSTDFVNCKDLLWHDRVAYSLNTTHEPNVNLSIGGENITLMLGTKAQKLESARRLFPILKSIDRDSFRDAVEQLEFKTGSGLSLEGELPSIYASVDWGQVKEMMGSGLISVGSHTTSHMILTRCSPETAAKELYDSKRIIEQETGRSCELFCYPNGTIKDFDERTVEQLKGCGYSCALTTIPGMNTEGADVFQLKRLSAPPHLSEFSVTLAGVKQVITSIKRFM